MDKEQYILKETIDNKKLNSLMNDAKIDPSETNMTDLLKEAAVSKFIVPLVISDDGNISFQAMNNSSGQNFMVVYADTKSYEIRAEGKPLYGVVSGFEELIEACLANPSVEGFVVNPGLEEILFGKDMLSMISDVMHGGDDTAKVGEPDHYPSKLREMLEEYLKVEPKINKIWVRLMRVNKNGSLSWLFILEGDYKETKDYVHETFSSFIKPYLDGLDLVVASSEDDFAGKVIDGVKPFIAR